MKSRQSQNAQLSRHPNLILAVLPGKLAARISPSSPFQAALKAMAVEWMESQGLAAARPSRYNNKGGIPHEQRPQKAN